MASRAERTVAVFLAGLVLGSILAAGAVATLQPSDEQISPDSPPYSVASATGCVDSEAGWLHGVRADERTYVTSNVTVRHAADETATLRLTHVSSGLYAAHLTVEQTDKEGSPPEGCTPGTTLDLSATLPGNATEVRLTHEGEVVATIDVSDGVGHDRVPVVNASA